MDDWLASSDLTTDFRRKIDGRRRCIPRVPENLRKMYKKSETEVFEPKVVSIGPYHSSKTHLLPMEDVKKAAAKRFIDNSPHPADSFHIKVREVATEAKECYVDLPHDLTDEKFIDMMFFDGCFLLHFIDYSHRITSPDGRRILKDLFLLENQLPFVVLTALMSLKPVNLNVFLFQNFFGRIGDISPIEPSLDRFYHLLDLLWMRIVRQKLDRPTFQIYKSSTRSATEHMEVGIQFRKMTPTQHLDDLRFKSGFLHGTLSMPVLTLDDFSRSLYLNLIALEECVSWHYGVSSYIWFMRQLVQEPADAKELRSSEILFNVFGTDQQIVELFKDLAMCMTPNHNFDIPILEEINNHYGKKLRLYVIKMMQVHFNQWGTNPIAFAAATYLLILTTIQTYFSVRPPKHGSN